MNEEWNEMNEGWEKGTGKITKKEARNKEKEEAGGNLHRK